MKRILFLFMVFFMSLSLYSSEENPTQDEVTKLYVATFNRAPDSAGIKYWLNSGLKLSQIAESFFDQPETKLLYPSSVETGEFVNAIYRNLFNREPDKAGFDYWVKELDNGKVPKQSFIQTAINGALGDDAVILNNKMEIGKYFAIDLGFNNYNWAKSCMVEITADGDTVKAVKNGLKNCNLNKNYTKQATLKGQINYTLKNGSRGLNSKKGGLWLSPTTVNVAIRANKLFNCQIAPNMTRAKKIPLVPTLKRDLEVDYTYEIKDVPSGTYDLIYIDDYGNGKKIDDIILNPDETKTQNINKVSKVGGVKLKIQSLSGSVLANATVILNELDKDYKTDSNGSVTIDDLPEGTYSLSIFKEGFVAKYIAFVVKSAKVTDLQTIELNNQKGRVTGKVIIDDDEITNYANIIVYAKSADGSDLTTLTDKEGNYHFDLAVGKNYSIIAYSHDFGVGRVDKIDIESGKETKADTIKLSSANGSISGYVRFKNIEGNNHAGILVSLEKSDKEAVTARDGSFIINDIEPGTYNINFTDSNYIRVTKKITVVRGANSYIGTVELMPKRGKLKLKVLDNEKNPISDVDIYVEDSNDSTATYKTNEEGVALLSDIKIGKHTIKFKKDKFATVTKTIDLNTSFLDITDKPIVMDFTNCDPNEVLIDGKCIYHSNPIADAGGNKTVIVNQEVTITGKGDVNNSEYFKIVSYEWKRSYSISEDNKAFAKTATFTYKPTQVGTENFYLFVKDNAGGLGISGMTLTVIYPPELFVTTWRTDNDGKSEDNQITIPTDPKYSYNYDIDWGDGKKDSGVTGDITHTYDSKGSYTIKISGEFPHLYFKEDNVYPSNKNDSNKLTSVEQWGKIEWKDMSKMFYCCGSVVINAKDIPNLSNVTDMSYMFSNTNSFGFGVTNIEKWDVSNVTNMSHMFDTSGFNQNINNWDVSNVTNMSHLFANSGFNQDISKWDVSNVTDMSYMFANSKFNQDISSWNVSNVIYMYHMFENATSFSNHDLSGWNVSKVEDSSLFSNNWGTGNKEPNFNTEAFITVWKTDNQGKSEDNQITIPTDPKYSYNYDIDWGDGKKDSGVTGDITHTYDSAGSYKVRISGKFPHLYFEENNEYGNKNDSYKLISVEQWGKIEWKDMSKMFYWCKNMTSEANDIPNLSNVKDMSYMFSNTNGSNLTIKNIEKWDVSNVTNMSHLFENSHFNLDISSWNVSNVTDMSYMFNGVFSFDKDISSWNVSNVTDMSHMFANTGFMSMGFNQDISSWNVSNVTNMSHMFEYSNFNKDISSWNVSNVTDMSYMFSNSSFNKDIGGWNVSNVTNMNHMFADANIFDKPLNSWDVSKVTDMSAMFSSAKSFNQPLDKWNVSNVTNMDYMFMYAESFNQDISKWNVSNVTNMDYMFYGAKSFSNHNLTNWNVDKVGYHMSFSDDWGSGNTEPNWK